MEIKIELTFDREAKNTVRYLETTQPQRLYQGVVYIQKAALGGRDYPRELEMTIAPKVKLSVVRS